MTKSRMSLRLVLVAGCAVGLLSCSQQTPQQTAQAPPPIQALPSAQTAVPAATQIAPAATGLGSNQFAENPAIRCDLLEVKRVSGNALLVRWRVVNTGDTQVTYDFQWEKLYYIDPAENKRYSYLTDSEGNKILDAKWGSMKPSEQWLSWAKFPAPPPSSTKISVNIGGFAPFEDVSVAP
jgi:hypothetical protein